MTNYIATPRIVVFLIILIIVCIGIIAILLVKVKELNSKYDTLSDAHNQEHTYRYTNPLNSPVLDSNIEASPIILHFNDTKPKLDEEIGKHGNPENVGLFLQDIRTGAWLGINEREGFFPASMLKVPIMVAVLKKIGRNELTFEDTIELIHEDIDPYAGNLYQRGSGIKMTVWDLIKEMILSSDNTAKNALKRQLTDAEINAVFAHVGIPNPYLPQSDQTVTPRGYTRILKSLYYSSFLPPDLSERALDIMTDTEMEILLSAGVPPEVQISHKFSERPDSMGDCGIIYEPKNPYLLCIMTKNMNPMDAKTLISSLSKIIYIDISSK